MAASLQSLATHDPATSAVFIGSATTESHGKYLFLHHALYVVCADSELETPDEQVRGLATSMWDCLPAPARDFWERRASVARMARDRKEYLLTDRSTLLSIDHCDHALDALDNWKKASVGGLADPVEVREVDALLLEREQHELPNVAHTTPDIENAATQAQDKVPQPSEDRHAVQGAGEGSSTPELLSSGDSASPRAQDAHSPKLGSSSVSDTSLSSVASEADDYNDSNPASQKEGMIPNVMNDSAGKGDEIAVSVERLPLQHEEKSICAAREEISETDTTPDPTPQLIQTEKTPANSSKRRSQFNSNTAAFVPMTHPALAEQTSFLQPCTLPLDSTTGPSLPLSQDSFSRMGAMTISDTNPELDNDIPDHSQQNPPVHPDPSAVLSLPSTEETEQSTIPDPASAIEHEQATTAHFEDNDYESTEVPPKCSYEAELAELAKLESTKMSWADLMDEESDREAAEKKTLVAPLPIQYYPSTVDHDTTLRSGDALRTAISSNRTNVNTLLGTEHPPISSAPMQGMKKSSKKPAMALKAKAAKGEAVLPLPEPAWSKPMSKKQNTSTSPNWPAVSASPNSSQWAVAAESVLPGWAAPPEYFPAPQLPRKSPVTGVSHASEHGEDEGEGENLFLKHALNIICEDMEMYEPDEWATEVALLMWHDLPRPAKRSWMEDARGEKVSLRVDSAYLYHNKRPTGSVNQENLYRVELIKALADRNDGELKALQKEYDEIMKFEKRVKKANRQRLMRDASKHIEWPTPRPTGPLPHKSPPLSVRPRPYSQV